MMGGTDHVIQGLDEQIERALLHVITPFHWCGLTSHQHAAVYWHVRGKSARAIGKIMGKSRYTVWGYLRQAVKKINEAEDWDIKIVDLPDMLLKLIKEELDGEERS